MRFEEVPDFLRSDDFDLEQVQRELLEAGEASD